MVVLHAHVHHGHDDLRTAGIELLPRLEEVDIGSRLPCPGRTVVMVVPLLAYLRVIDRSGTVGELGAHGRIEVFCRQYAGIIGPPYSVNRLHMAHTGNGGEVTGGPRDRDIVAYPDIVPQMQAEPPPPFSEPASLGKYAPYLRGTQPGSRFVDCPVARLRCTPRETPHAQCPGIVGEPYPHPSVHIILLFTGNVFRSLPRPFRHRGCRRLPRTGGNRNGRQSGQHQSGSHQSFNFRFIVCFSVVALPHPASGTPEYGYGFTVSSLRGRTALQRSASSRLENPVKP